MWSQVKVDVDVDGDRVGVCIAGQERDGDARGDGAVDKERHFAVLSVDVLPVIGYGGVIRTVNTQTNLPFGKRIAIGKTPGSIVINPSGTTAYVTNNGGGVSVMDLMTRTVTDTVDDDAIPTNIAMSPDASTVYVANASPSGPDLTIIDTSDNSATSQDLAGPGAYGVAVN